MFARFSEWIKDHKILAIGGVVGLIVFYYIYEKMAGSSSANDNSLAEEQALLNAGVPTATEVQAQQVQDQLAAQENAQNEQAQLAGAGIEAQNEQTVAQLQSSQTQIGAQLSAALADIGAQVTASNNQLAASQQQTQAQLQALQTTTAATQTANEYTAYTTALNSVLNNVTNQAYNTENLVAQPGSGGSVGNLNLPSTLSQVAALIPTPPPGG